MPKITDQKYIIETKRLILRIPNQSDFEEFAKMYADENVMRFIGGTQQRAIAWRSLAGLVGSWHLLGFGMFSVIEKSSGQWLGRIGPIHPEGWPDDEVGWGLNSSSQGKGYATEAAAACMDFAFDVLRWNKVIHVIDKSNIASQNVARKLGSRNLGPTILPPPNDIYDVEAWGQTHEEWQENRKKFNA